MLVCTHIHNNHRNNSHSERRQKKEIVIAYLYKVEYNPRNFKAVRHPYKRIYVDIIYTSVKQIIKL